MTPQDFLISKGWEYHGTCGCSVNMHKYKNPLIRGAEVRIGVKVTKFEIRKYDKTKYQGNSYGAFETLYFQEFGSEGSTTA